MADYKTVYDLPLTQELEKATVMVYSADIYLPFGDVTPMNILCYIPNKDNKDEEIKPKIIPISASSIVKNAKEPITISQVFIIYLFYKFHCFYQNLQKLLFLFNY